MEWLGATAKTSAEADTPRLHTRLDRNPVDSKLEFFRRHPHHTNCVGASATCDFLHRDHTHTLFVGDSITREIFLELHNVSNNTCIDPNKPCSIPDVSHSQMPTFHWAAVSNVELLRKLTSHACVSAVASKKGNGTARQATDVWIGGNALHFLLRRYPKKEPIGDYVNLITPVLQFLSTNCINSVFVGPITVDETLFLSPPKRDWQHFESLQLLHLWQQHAKALARRYGVRYFDTDAIVLRHPRCRCDGMHFGSAYSEWNCTSTRHLWRYEICRQLAAFDPHPAF